MTFLVTQLTPVPGRPRSTVLRGWALAVWVVLAASCGGTVSGPSGRDGSPDSHPDAHPADASGRDVAKGGSGDGPMTATDAGHLRDAGQDARAEGTSDGGQPDARDAGMPCLLPTDHVYHVQATPSLAAETGSLACPYRSISGALSAISAAQENATYLVKISVDGDLDPSSQPANEFPIEVPTGVDIAGSVTPAPTITIPAGAAGGFTYSYAGPTTSPGKDGGHLENLSLVQAGAPAATSYGVRVQNTYMGPLGNNLEYFQVQTSGLAVRGFDRGIDVEQNGNLMIVGDTVAESNNDGLYVSSGCASTTPTATHPVHFDHNASYGVFGQGSPLCVYFYGAHTSTGGRSITMNDNGTAGVSLSVTTGPWNYLLTIELRGNPVGAQIRLKDAVSITDSVIADNGMGVELMPGSAAAVMPGSGAMTYLGNDIAGRGNQFSGNAPDLCVTGAYVSDWTIFAANNIWSGGVDCTSTSPLNQLTVDKTGCGTAANLGFTNFSSGFTDTNLQVTNCTW